MTGRYGIWCVGLSDSGTWLRRGDGAKVAMFDNLAEAEAECDRLNEAGTFGLAHPPLAAIRFFAQRFPVLGRRQKGTSKC